MTAHTLQNYRDPALAFQEALIDRMTFSTGNPVELTMTALALRWAKDNGCHELALALVKAKRAERRAWLTRTQRDWQTKVSRRPARGRHHDSWRIREDFVRVGNGGY